MEKLLKLGVKVLVILFALFGIRYLLSLINIIVPLEWFIIMSFGMMGFYGIILMIIYVIYINFN